MEAVDQHRRDGAARDDDVRRYEGARPVTEHPILFNEPMSAAARAGRKSQTRRVVRGESLNWLNSANFTPECVAQRENGFSPYGYDGDRLWVRETHIAYGRWETRYSAKKERDEWHFVDMTLETGREYRFDGEVPNAARGGVLPTWWRRPSIFMPRAAARTLLEVTGVRVVRLQNISEPDARAEGVTIEGHHMRGYCAGAYRPPSIRAFHDLWDNLNAARGHGWDTDPWVWAVEFRRIGS
ncbi:hypothetical protein [Burkholderia vietnamiensis]|uniref:hypothetical protein n=1 Tax=Burkholderia vietnamiensis TaxID=60552 RepID=UPI001FC85651|nr:hypothetical protein [Burkholderia vietnamiensis]